MIQLFFFSGFSHGFYGFMPLEDFLYSMDRQAYEEANGRLQAIRQEREAWPNEGKSWISFNI